jgi:SAM-dependent methyltransferase/uncharacterized protein YbaR (Trm112 family)
MSVAIDPWFIANLACPIDHTGLSGVAAELCCAQGHRYPVVDGVPVMLRTDVGSTISLADASLQRARGAGIDQRAPDLHLESLGISDDEKRGVLDWAARPGQIDPVVAYLVAATNGLMYKHLIGGLQAYPIPEITLAPGRGRRLLDVGCSWGRWTVAAHRAGYDAVGIDPSLGAVMAARRVAKQLDVPNHYICADARHLPFPACSIDAVYSYSVLQHLSRADAQSSVAEMGRVVKAGGVARVQMPTRFGIRCLYHQARRGFREGRGFEVRYWTGGELQRVFTASVGPTRIEPDCFFGIGLQATDEAILTPTLQRVLRASEWMKARSRRWPALVTIADSVFALAVKPALPTEDE